MTDDDGKIIHPVEVVTPDDLENAPSDPRGNLEDAVNRWEFYLEVVDLAVVRIREGRIDEAREMLEGLLDDARQEAEQEEGSCYDPDEVRDSQGRRLG